MYSEIIKWGYFIGRNVVYWGIDCFGVLENREFNG